MSWNHGDVTFDIGPVTLNLKFPSALYDRLNESRFRIGICRDYDLRDKGVSRQGFMETRPLTLAQ
jgi:hypothetical protein